MGHWYSPFWDPGISKKKRVLSSNPSSVQVKLLPLPMNWTWTGALRSGLLFVVVLPKNKKKA